MASHILKDKQAQLRYKELVHRITSNNLVDAFETPDAKKIRIAMLKNDFKAAVEYYFSHYGDSETPDFHIRIARRVRRNPKYKAWLKWARGHAKSVVAIVLLPLWLWINGDIKFLLVVGQTEDKAKILLGDLQAEFEHNPRLIADFGVQRVLGQWEAGFFTTTSGFKAKAIGMGQDPRGIRVGADRPDMIVADDWESKETAKNPRRQDEYAEWFLRGVLPSMDNKNRRVLIAQNHWTPRMIFSKIVEENHGWNVDQVNGYNPTTYEPAWKEKYDPQFFRDVELEMGTIRALAEYNNTPHVEGKLFLDEYIQWGPIPRMSSFEALVGRWDVAYGGTATSDYSAVRIWGLKEGKKYLIDCFVKQAKLKTALAWIADFQMNLKEGISIQIGFESQLWNEEVYRNIEETEEEFKIKLNLIKIDVRKGNKYDHMITMLPQYQNSRIVYSDKLKDHNDTQVGLAQLKGLEPGYKTKDDAPDADVYSFDYLDQFSKAKQFKHRVKRAENRKF